MNDEVVEMNYSECLKQMAGEADLPRDMAECEAESVFAAMLDGGVPELELGAILAMLHQKGESASELLGFGRALATRVARLERVHESVLPVVLPVVPSVRRVLTRSAVTAGPVVPVLMAAPVAMA